MSATHLLVANPTAQSGRGAERIERAQHFLRYGGVQCALLPTLPGGGTVGAVKAAVEAGDYRVVIAMGGDGTFREVAAGLLDGGAGERVALGMLPTGTANDQGKSFGLEADEGAVERNVRVILEGHETRLDAGRLEARDRGDGLVESAWFFDSAGFGITARVLAVRNRDREAVGRVPLLRQIYRDQLVYAGAFVRTFLESYVFPDKFDALAVVDGRAVELPGLTDLVIKNTRIYAGAWIFDRASRHDDGLFELVPFHGKRDWTSKALLHHEESPLDQAELAEVGIRQSPLYRFAHLELSFQVPEGAAPLAAQIDGEEFPATERVTVEVRPRALRLIVPAPGSAAQ